MERTSSLRLLKFSVAQLLEEQSGAEYNGDKDKLSSG